MPRFSDAQVSAALAGRRVPHVYDVPALGCSIAMRLLTDADVDAARVAAVRYAKEKGAELTLDPEFLDRSIHRYVLFAAMRDAEDPTRTFFREIDEVLTIDPLLVRTLYELYCTHQQAMDPLAFVPAEEVDMLVEQLGKSAVAAARLSLFDRSTLVSFVLSMASKLRETQPTLRSSTGSSATE